MILESFTEVLRYCHHWSVNTDTHGNCKLDSSSLIYPRRKSCKTLTSVTLGSCQFTSPDMSSTPHKITRNKWTIYINDTPKVELAIASMLVTIEHERSDFSNIEIYRYFRIAYGTFWVLFIPNPSSGSLKSKGRDSRKQIVIFKEEIINRIWFWIYIWIGGYGKKDGLNVYEIKWRFSWIAFQKLQIRWWMGFPLT